METLYLIIGFWVAIYTYDGTLNIISYYLEDYVIDDTKFAIAVLIVILFVTLFKMLFWPGVLAYRLKRYVEYRQKHRK